MPVLTQFGKGLRIPQTRSRVCFDRVDAAGLRAAVMLAVLVLFVFANATPAEAQDSPRYPSAGSTFVSVDSWVYPIFERLAGLGYVKSAMFGMKPWTRTECARLTDEAGDVLRDKLAGDGRVDELSAQMIGALEKEFAAELLVLGGGRNRSAALESVYTRVLSIMGPPLTDGYHFGQTIDYDFGRPNRRGTNAIAGASAYATYGPLAVQFRGEYQHAPSAPPLSDAVLDVIALRDFIPRPAPTRFNTINRFRLLDTSASLTIANWQLSFGKQTLNWGSGPSATGGLLFSNNAEPLYMARITRALAHRLPGPLRLLGPVRSEFFVSRLQGHQIFAGPIIYGHRVTTKPGRNFEVSFGRTTLLGGGDRRVTFSGFVRSFFGIKQRIPGATPGGGLNTGTFREGDSRNSFDWSWRIPGVREWLTFYGELYADDDEAGFMNPTKAVYKPGIWLSRIPGLQQMDLRFEVANSESPGRQQHRGSLNYWNFEFPDGHTNNGSLIGNTVGRQGRALRTRLTYWVSSNHLWQFDHKHTSVDSDFIPGGGVWDDLVVRHSLKMSNGFFVQSTLAYERIASYPLFFPGSRSNVAASIQIGVLTREHLKFD